MSIYRYGPDGHTVGEPEFQPPAPIRLQWDLNDKAIAAIDTAYQVHRFQILGETCLGFVTSQD